MIYSVLFLAVLTAFSLSATPAYAYIDPSSGSMIIQMIVASLAGTLFTIKLYWHKIKEFFGCGSKREDDKGDDET